MTILNPAVELALPQLRAEAEALMVSSCTISTPGKPVRDPATGTHVPGEPVVHYAGKCRLRWPAPAPQDGSAGQTAHAVDRVGTLSIPVGAPPVPAGAIATITANPLDPTLVGLELKVLIPQGQTHSTARRLPVQTADRDAGPPS